MGYAIVRSGQSGVWCGDVVDRTGDSVTLNDARKIWRWRGANTTSDIAIGGISEEYSRVAPAVDGAVILGVCEVLPATEEAVARVKKAGWSK
jgi:uncharacterized protein DUF6948